LFDGRTKVEARDVILPAVAGTRVAPQEPSPVLESPEPRETRAAPVETARTAARIETPPARADEKVETTPRTELTSAPPVKTPPTPVVEQAIPTPTPVLVASASLPAVWGAAQPPQEAPVRATLARYAAAYSDLNVDAAVRVWPGVNRTALSHAFDNLRSQSVSLGDCQVQVEGDAARARCMGSATWRPKVGGGQRTDARSWDFELERTDAGWYITSARAQNR
jgi:hypothetical protein